MTACVECGTEYLEGAPTCPGCGVALEVFECARCGEEFDVSDACPACGLGRAPFPCAVHGDLAAEGRCVICGTALCKECAAGSGRVHSCVAHREVPVIQGWAQVYSNADEFEAQLLRDNLIAEGIDARIFSQKDNMFSVDLGELSIVRLLVPAWAYEQAERIIRDHMDAEGEVAFACPSCGEAFEPGVATCAACGADLAARKGN